MSVESVHEDTMDNCSQEDPQNLQEESGPEAEDDVSIETESNASREDTAAKIEHTLLKKLKMEEQNGDHENGYTEPPPLDPRTLEGYVEIPENCPTWKKAMLEKKNKQVEDEARRQWLEVKAEEERWKGVPEWKKKIILEKQKKKTDEESEEDMRRQEQQAKLEHLPEWKQNILRKKMSDL